VVVVVAKFMTLANENTQDMEHGNMDIYNKACIKTNDNDSFPFA
jgi:hypothetical protein